MCVWVRYMLYIFVFNLTGDATHAKASDAYVNAEHSRVFWLGRQVRVFQQIVNVAIVHEMRLPATAAIRLFCLSIVIQHKR